MSTGATLKHVGLTTSQELDLDDLAQKVTKNTKMVALVHVSNVLAAQLPAADAAEIAHKAGALLLLDCCQSVPHMPVDVQVRLSLFEMSVAGAFTRTGNHSANGIVSCLRNATANNTASGCLGHRQHDVTLLQFTLKTQSAEVTTRCRRWARTS